MTVPIIPQRESFIASLPSPSDSEFPLYGRVTVPAPAPGPKVVHLTHVVESRPSRSAIFRY